MAAKKSQPAVFTLMGPVPLVGGLLGSCKCKNIWKQLLCIMSPRVLFKFYFKYQLVSYSSTQSTLIGKSMSRDEGASPPTQKEHLNAKSRTLLTSVHVNRPYKELLPDLVLLEEFSLAVLLMCKSLISPKWDRGILCCIILCYFDFLHSFSKFSSYFSPPRMCLKF